MVGTGSFPDRPTGMEADRWGSGASAWNRNIMVAEHWAPVGGLTGATLAPPVWIAALPSTVLLPTEHALCSALHSAAWPHRALRECGRLSVVSPSGFLSANRRGWVQQVDGWAVTGVCPLSPVSRLAWRKQGSLWYLSSVFKKYSLGLYSRTQ